MRWFMLFVGALLLLALPLLLDTRAEEEATDEAFALTDGADLHQRWPVIAADNGTLHAVWVAQSGGGGAVNVLYARSNDSANWSAPVQLNDMAASVRWQQERPALAVAGDEVYVFWVSRSDPERLMLRASRDGGVTWGDETVVWTLHDGQKEAFPAAAIDGLGVVHLTWQDAEGHDGLRQLMVVSSSDGGANWSEPLALDPFDTGNVNAPEGGYPCDCCFATVVGAADGGLHVAYRNISRYPDNDTWYNFIVYVRWDGVAQPTTSVRVAPDWITGGRICPADGPEVIETPEGVAIAWRDQRSGTNEIYLAYGDAAGFGAAQRLGPGFNPALARTPDGLAVAWWSEGEGRDVWIARGEDLTAQRLALPGNQSHPDLVAGALVFQDDASGKWEVVGRWLAQAINGTTAPAPEEPVAAREGFPAPGFALVDTEGNIFSLVDYRGQVVVLDLMATWCSVCKAFAADSLMPLQADIDRGALKGVAIISIGVDRAETNGMLAELAQAEGYGWRHAIDTPGARVAENYDAPPVPVVAVVDAEGNLTFLRLGYVDAETLRGEVAAALGQSGAPAAQEDEGLPGPSLVLALAVLAVAARRRRG